MTQAANVPKPTPTDRREEILLHAAAMFSEKGYDGTTIRDLLGQMDLKSASLYYFFKNKHAILFVLVTALIDQLTAGARKLVGAEPTYELKLAALVCNHVVLHALRPAEARLGDTELRSLTGKHREANIRARDKYETFVRKVLRDGARHAEFDLLDERLTAYALIAESSNVGVWYRRDGRLSLEQVAWVQAGLALRAVGSEPVDREDIERLCAAAVEFHEGHHQDIERLCAAAAEFDKSQS